MEEPKVQNDINLLIPEFKVIIEKLIIDLNYHNIPMKLFETLRTIERQKFVFDKGYSTTMKSKHLDGIACDFVVFKDNKWSWDYKKYDYYYEMFGTLAVRKYGLIWGGLWNSFKDYPHIQYK